MDLEITTYFSNFLLLPRVALYIYMLHLHGLALLMSSSLNIFLGSGRFRWHGLEALGLALLGWWMMAMAFYFTWLLGRCMWCWLGLYYLHCMMMGGEKWRWNGEKISGGRERGVLRVVMNDK